MQYCKSIIPTEVQKARMLRLVKVIETITRYARLFLSSYYLQYASFFDSNKIPHFLLVQAFLLNLFDREYFIFNLTCKSIK